MSQIDLLLSSVPRQPILAVQRLRKLAFAFWTSGFSPIAVIMRTTPVDSQCLVLGEKQPVGGRQAGATLKARYHRQ